MFPTSQELINALVERGLTCGQVAVNAQLDRSDVYKIREGSRQLREDGYRRLLKVAFDHGLLSLAVQTGQTESPEAESA